MLWFGKIFELYQIVGEWGFRFFQYIKLAEHISSHSLHNKLAIHLTGFSDMLEQKNSVWKSSLYKNTKYSLVTDGSILSSDFHVQTKKVENIYI